MDIDKLIESLNVTRIERQVKISIRKMAYRSYWNDFTSTVFNSSELTAIFVKYPGFGLKIFKPYLSKSFNIKERSKTIIENYTFWVKKGLFEFIFKTIDNYQTIANFDGRNNNYTLQLKTDVDYWHEGEHILTLFKNDSPCYSISFTLSQHEDKPCIYVGSIQGTNSHNSNELIRSTTKDFFGLRPRDFLILVLLEMGKMLGCSKLLLIDNQNRICTVRKYNKAQFVYSDYDQIWTEFGAKKIHNDFFEVCTSYTKIDILKSSSKRRSNKKKRLALTQEVANILEFNFLKKDSILIHATKP